jgi:hypothetical protein
MKGEHAIEFPFEWTNDIYCGRIETEFIDRPEPKSGIFTLPNVSIIVKDYSPSITQPTKNIIAAEPYYKITPTSNILNFLYKK